MTKQMGGGVMDGGFYSQEQTFSSSNHHDLFKIRSIWTLDFGLDHLLHSGFSSEQI